MPIGDYAAHQIPDIVGSLRVDQAWGSAQISAAAHQIRGGQFIDVGLVAEMPADGTGVLVRAPGHLVRGEVFPQFVGVGAGAVVLMQQCLQFVHDFTCQ